MMHAMEQELMRSSRRVMKPWKRHLSCCSILAFLLGWVITVVVVTNRTHRACEGRWVYVYKLPEVYNRDFVRDCATFKKGRDLCMYMENEGLGRGFRYEPAGGGSSRSSWHNTWQFALELYFHERLVRHYPCLTDRQDLANAFFVPFYAGMDLSRRFTHRLPKSALYSELATWLQTRASWQRRRGRDHFMVLGRIASDFRRPGDHRSWGNEGTEYWNGKWTLQGRGFRPWVAMLFLVLNLELQMLLHAAFKEMVVLSIERSAGEISIPYPTYFHPHNGESVRALVEWQLETSQRVSLVTMAAGRRQLTTNKVRHRLMAQCEEDPRCTLLRCVGHEASPDLAAAIRNVSLPVKMDGETLEVSCNNPPLLLSAMHQSVFCLQPPGDSPTRRSFFDALLVGCIPVIFHKDAAWSQYVHHLPKHGSNYSIFISMEAASTSNVIDILNKVETLEISKMQVTIAELVPRVLYSHLKEVGEKPSSPDAFDIAMETMLDKILVHEKPSSHNYDKFVIED